MRTRQVLILLLFIVTICVISLIPFSNMGVNATNEGFDPSDKKEEEKEKEKEKEKEEDTTFILKPNNLTFSFPSYIKNNTDLINAISFVNTTSKDRNTDLLYIQKIHSHISNIKSKNAATLMSELTNPNNLIDTRVFLQYMNWFSSHCPLESDTCAGVS